MCSSWMCCIWNGDEIWIEAYSEIVSCHSALNCWGKFRKAQHGKITNDFNIARFDLVIVISFYSFNNNTLIFIMFRTISHWILRSIICDLLLRISKCFEIDLSKTLDKQFSIAVYPISQRDHRSLYIFALFRLSRLI